MADPYIGEIRMFAGSFAPAGWLFCAGQDLLISEYDVLFALVGTTYGGDGRTTFALPDLRGRSPLGWGAGPSQSSYTLGQPGGQESVTLTTDQLPAHTHTAQASAAAATGTAPGGATWAATTSAPYSPAAPTTTMASAALDPAGGGQPHGNRVPSLAISFIIAVNGTVPSQT